MHDFFRNLNWALLREREGEVPFVPQLDDEQDVSYFIPKVASSPRGIGQSPFVARQVRARRVAAPSRPHFGAVPATRVSRAARDSIRYKHPLIAFRPLVARCSQPADRVAAHHPPVAMCCS